MMDAVVSHYCGSGDLVDAIAERLRRAGRNLDALTTADLATVDEFHIRGRNATLELAERMNLDAASHVLDIGCGLGGPARTLAETYGCRVTGVDLARPFCDAANVLSEWVGLADRVAVRQGDATDLPFADDRFDAAMTIHAGMNVPDKAGMYEEALRVVRPGGIAAVYDVLQGDGGDVVFPVPWARDPSISHLATPDEMESLLTNAGLKILDVHDSTDESRRWFEAMTTRMAQSGAPAVTFEAVLGAGFLEMARNQIRNLAERRIRTVSYICRA